LASRKSSFFFIFAKSARERLTLSLKGFKWQVVAEARPVFQPSLLLLHRSAALLSRPPVSHLEQRWESSGAGRDTAFHM
jgi:hypothetical protein